MNPQFICPYDLCFEKNVFFKKREELCHHIDTIHKNDLQQQPQEEHNCSICDYTTQSIDDLVIHKQKNHVCHWCNYSTAKNYSMLTLHMSTKHFCARCGIYTHDIKIHDKAAHECVIS
jgi:hypothetical protein